MTITATERRPQIMTVSERRRVLCEFADQYTAEDGRNDRPLTDALPTLLWLLVAAHLASDGAIDLFDRFAAARAVSADAHAGYDVIAAAERRAEQLLDQLVGQSPS